MQLLLKDTELSRKIVKVRIHVEGVIELFKK